MFWKVGFPAYSYQLIVTFGFQDGVALPTTEKTLPFGGEVWSIFQLVTYELAINLQGNCTPLIIGSLVVTIEKEIFLCFFTRIS